MIGRFAFALLVCACLLFTLANAQRSTDWDDDGNPVIVTIYTNDDGDRTTDVLSTITATPTGADVDGVQTTPTGTGYMATRSRSIAHSGITSVTMSIASGSIVDDDHYYSSVAGSVASAMARSGAQRTVTSAGFVALGGVAAAAAGGLYVFL